jgi:hypothetical protein
LEPDVRLAALVPAQIVFDLELLLLFAGLGLLIVVGLYAVVELRRRMTLEEDEPLDLHHDLEHYEALRDQGLLDPDELERIRALLEARENRSSEPPPPPPPPVAS